MRAAFIRPALLAAAFGLFAVPALSAEIEIKMMNKGSDGQAMVFEPASVRAAVGDTIRFVSVDKGHDAAAVKELIPEGVEPFKGKISTDLTVTLDKEGAYVVKCTPHFGMGMVALVVVGEGAPTNLDTIKAAKMPKKTRERLDAEIANLGL